MEFQQAGVTTCKPLSYFNDEGTTPFTRRLTAKMPLRHPQQALACRLCALLLLHLLVVRGEYDAP